MKLTIIIFTLLILAEIDVNECTKDNDPLLPVGQKDAVESSTLHFAPSSGSNGSSSGDKSSKDHKDHKDHKEHKEGKSTPSKGNKEAANKSSSGNHNSTSNGGNKGNSKERPAKANWKCLL